MARNELMGSPPSRRRVRAPKEPEIALPRSLTALAVVTSVRIDARPTPRSVLARNFRARARAELASRPGRLLAACLATALAPALILSQTTARATVRPHAPDARGGGSETPPVPDYQEVIGPIRAHPGDWVGWTMGAHMAAATCPGLPPDILLAVAEVETRLGRGQEPSTAGALGPMQFMPDTWQAYGTDGDGDGRADVMNPLDALHAAARLLCANGGADPTRLRSALWNYNHSDEYVDKVLRVAGGLDPRAGRIAF